MRVAVYVSAANALRAGKDQHGALVVDVPAEELSAEQRAELARWADHIPADVSADFSLTSFNGVKISEATVETVRAVLDAAIAWRAEQARKEDEQADKLAALRQWSEQFGSELLRARIADGYDWSRLAVREYADSVITAIDCGLLVAHTPYGFGAAADERPCPTLAEIIAVRAIRSRIAKLGCGASVGIQWVEYTSGDRSPDDDFNRAEIVITVTGLTGSERKYYFLPPTE